METMPWGFSLNFDQHNEQVRCRATFDATVYDPTGVRNLIGRFLHTTFKNVLYAKLLGDLTKIPGLALKLLRGSA